MAVAGPAFAQVAAPLVVPPTERVLPAPQPQFSAPRPEIPPAVESAPEGPRVRVDQVVVEGGSVYSDAELRAIYGRLIGTTPIESQIADVLQEIRTKYNSDGYVLTTVRGSVEPVAGGNQLVIHVIEGFINDVRLEGDIGPAGTLVYRYLRNLTLVRPINIAALERYLLLAQDVPGVSVRAVLRPSPGEIGGVQLVAQVSRSPFSGYASYDNRGPDFAGPHEVLLSAGAQSFTSLGERVEALFFNTLSDEQFFGQASGQILLGSEGFKLHGYLGAGNTQPGGVFEGTGFNGDLLIGGIEASYPLIRTRPLSVSLLGDFDIYESSISVTGAGGERQTQSNSRLRIVRGGTQINFQDAALASLPAANLVIMRVHHGLEGLGSSSNDSALPARPGNKIDFTKFTGEFSRIQNLAQFGDWGLALQETIGGQYTDDILPPSEKFFLGGNRFGRGFFSGEITGDRAFGNSLELQLNTRLPSFVDFLGESGTIPAQWYAFYDVGHSYDLAPGDVDRKIESAGLGIRLTLTDNISTELEGVRRFTRTPTGDNVSPEKAYAVFGKVVARF